MTRALSDVRCQRCSRAHRFGLHGVGDRVLVRATTPRADGIQAGTRGVVVAYRILPGAQHQEVEVRIKGKKGTGRVIVFAPCELASDMPAAPAPRFENVTREQFRTLLRQRHVVVRMVAE